jgi:hypothetical protein
MTQTISFQSTSDKLIPFKVIKAAKNGDIDAMTLIQRHYDPYIRSLATIEVNGTNYLDTDLYDRLKTRLTLSTLQFEFKD